MEEQPFDIHHLLKLAFTSHASDLHITVGAPPIFRVDGELKRYGQQLLTPEATEQMARTLIKREQYDHFVGRGELDFSYGIPGVSRFRVNAYMQRSCIGLVARVIPTSVPSLQQLNMPESLYKFAYKPQGLLLVTGPTGSGKSTTLAALIDYINQQMSRHIITLEDPIEYLHRHGRSIINQREVGFDTHNFANGLRAALRQDPDVILVGEMRDLETIHTAITAAETGHLVLGTLHTSDASQTIDRIIDVFPAHQQPQIRIQLASVLLGVVAQRLFPKAEGKGRVAATEILVNTPAIANLIRQEKVHQIRSMMQTGKAQGMHTLEMSIKELMQEGLIASDKAKFYLPDEE